MTASIYPKIKSLILKVFTEMKKTSFGYNFDYITPCETSLVLMPQSKIIYNVHCSQLCETVKH